MRQEILDMFLGEPVGGHRGDKGRQGSVKAVEVLGESGAKYRVRKPFQRGQDQAGGSAI